MARCSKRTARCCTVPRAARSRRAIFPARCDRTGIVNVDAVILDLDGTLVDSSGEIHVAINRAFAEEGLGAMTRREVEALVGRGVRSLVERALPKVGGAATSLDRTV